MSGWCLIDPGYCQDCIDGIAIDINHFLSSYSTIAFLTDALHNANINRSDGVWKMSGGYLGGVGCLWCLGSVLGYLSDSGYCLGWCGSIV